MKSSIETRLRDLELRFRDNRILLTMHDGTERALHGDALDVWAHALANPRSEEAILMRQAVASREPGESKLWELFLALDGSPEESFEKGEKLQ